MTTTPLNVIVEERESPVALLHLKWDPDSGPSVRDRYPEDWPWTTRITKDMLSALYAITLISKKEAEEMRLKFKTSKVASIAKNDEYLLLLVLCPDQDFKDYSEAIRDIREKVQDIKDWEGILPSLFRTHLDHTKT